MELTMLIRELVMADNSWVIPDLMASAIPWDTVAEKPSFWTASLIKPKFKGLFPAVACKDPKRDTEMPRIWVMVKYSSKTMGMASKIIPRVMARVLYLT